MGRTLFRPLTALLAAVALIGSACGGGDPTSDLASSLQELADTSFRYSVAVDLDQEAAQALLGPDAGMIAGFVSSVALSGAREEGAVSFTAALAGFEPIAIRSYEGGEDLYVRLGIAEMAQAFGADLASLGLDAEAFAQLPGDAGQLFSELFAGEWIGFVGLDTERSADEQAAAELGLDLERFRQLGEDIRAQLDDVEALLEDVATVTETEVEGGTRYDVELRTEPLLRKVRDLVAPVTDALGEDADQADLEADLQEILADAPQTIPGLSVTVRDGDVTEIAFDVGVLLEALADDAEALQVEPDQAVIRLTFSEHGAASVEEPPADASTYDQEQLDQLSRIVGDPSMLEDVLQPAA